MKKRNLRSIFVNLLKILFAGGLITWLVSSGKINVSIFKVVMTPSYILICMGLMLIGILAASERWRMLLRNQGLESSFFKCFELSLVGIFFNFAMPGGVGGDVVKGFYLTRNHPEQKMKAALTVLMDRVIGLYGMILLAVLAMLYDYAHVVTVPELLSIFYLLIGLFGVATAGLGVAFSSKVRAAGWLDRLIDKLPKKHRLLHLYHSLNSYGHQPRVLLQTLFYSFFAQMSSIILFFIVGNALGEVEIALRTYLIVAPVGFMVTAIPISPAGVGVGQAAFYFLFNIYLGRKSEVGPTVMTVFQIFTLIFGFIGAIFYLRQRAVSPVANSDTKTNDTELI